MAGEIVAVTVGVFAIVAGIYKAARVLLNAHYRARRDDEALARIAQWFPDEKPNGEVSLPSQVKRLHACLDKLSGRVSKIEERLDRQSVK